MVRIVTILCLLFHTTTFAQRFPISPNAYDAQGKRTGHWTILYDSLFKKEVQDPDSAFYYRLVKFEAGKPIGKVRDFYRSGFKQWEGHLISLLPDVADGEVRYFFENGKIQQHMLMSQGKKDGPYRQYDPSGNLISEGTFKTDSMEGKWTSYWNNGAIQAISWYKDNKREGKVVEYNEQGVKEVEIEFQANQVNGLVQVFYPSGKVMRKGYKKLNVTEGWWDEYYENEKLKSHEHFKDGKNDGLIETYFDNGQVESKGNYRLDKKTGTWVNYFSNGNLSHTGSYDEDGLRTGTWKYYYENGRLKFTAYRKHDKLEGSYTEFFPSGKLKVKGTCQNDLWQGLLERYYENEQLEKRGHYIADSLDGEWVYYFDNGKISSIGKYIDNKKNGVWKYYRNNGSIETEETLKLKILEGPTVNYFPDGTIHEKKNYTDGKENGQYELFHPNGKIKVKGIKVNGQPEGEWLYYHANGQLESREYNHNGLWQGLYESYYENGVKRAEGLAANNKHEGYRKFYYRNGQLKGTGNMHLGNRHGHWVFYDSLTGKKESEGDYLNGHENGKWNFYNSKPHYIYYLDGNQETFDNVEDSVKLLADQGQHKKARQYLAKLNHVRKRDFGNAADKKTRMLYWNAYLASSEGNHAQAIDLYNTYASKIKKQQGDTVLDYLDAINNIAVINSQMNHIDEALTLLHSLDKKIARFSDSKQTRHQEIIADILLYSNRYEEAENYLTSILHSRQYSTQAIAKNTLTLKLKLANLYADQMGQSDKGIRAYQSLIDYADSVNLSGDYYCGLAYGKIASIYKNQYNRRSAIKWAKKANEILNKQTDRFAIDYLENLALIGNSYLNLSLPDSARLIFEEMNETIRSLRLGNTSYHANALNGLAETYYQNYDNVKAKELWMQSKLILENANKLNTASYVNVLQALSIVLPLLDKKDIPLAEEYLLRAVELSKQLGLDAKHRAMLYSLAEFYRNNSRYEEAKKIVEQNSSLLLAREGYSEKYLENQQLLGDILYSQSKYKEAIQVYETTLPLADSLKTYNPTNYITQLSNLSRTHNKLLNYDKAEEYAYQSLNAARHFLGNENITTLDALENVAFALRERSKFSEAEKLYKEAVEIIKKIRGVNNLKYAYSILGLAHLYNESNNYKKALEHYQTFLVLIESLKGKRSADYVNAMDYIADIHYNMGHEAQAEKIYTEALQLTVQVYGHKQLNYAWRLKTVGNFYLDIGNFTLAETYLEESVRLAKNYLGKETSDYANFLVSLSKAKSSNEKFKDAELLLLESVSIHKKNSDNRFGSYIAAIEQLEKFYERFGQYNAALQQVNTVLPLIAKHWGIEGRYAQNLLSKSGLYYGIGNFDSTSFYAHKALAIAEDLYAPTNWLVLKAHTEVGRAAIKNKNYDEALKHFQFCVEQQRISGRIKESTYATYLQNLGVAHMERKEFAAAEQLFNEAWNVSTQTTDTEGMDYIRLNQAKLYTATGRPDQAERLFKTSANNRKAYIIRNFYFLSDNQKAQYWKANKFFLEYFQSFATQHAVTNPAILQDFYNLQLATKGILLSTSNKIKKRILSSGDSIMVNIYYRWLKQRNELAQLYAQAPEEQKKQKSTVDSLEKIVSASEKELAISAEDLEKDKGKETNWREVQKQLLPNEAAVEIVRVRHHTLHPTDSVFYVALILTHETKTGPQMAVLPNGNLLEGRAYRYYKNAITSQLDDTLSYINYWSPIDVFVKNKKHIYVSADGVYNSINLNTLKSVSGNYLVEEKNITFVPNTKDLLYLKNKKNAFTKTTANLIGFPKYFLGKEKVKQKISKQRELDFSKLSDEDRSGIAELPGTKEEISTVSSILVSHQWHVKQLILEEATEEALKSVRQPGLLHIATHGYFTDDQDQTATDPMLRAGLLLSGASNYLVDKISVGEDNGVLTAYEAANLNLDNTELVILSACETGKGEVQNGEGVYGLQRAFQTAGAKSILMSLWKVDDAATQELMAAFYKNWTSGKTKSEAFKHAQLTLKKKYANPYYWGAFVMMGE